MKLFAAAAGGLAGLGAAALAVGASAALAQTDIRVAPPPVVRMPDSPGRDADWAACAHRNKAYTLAERLAGCTKIIESGRESPRRLAIAYLNRSLVHVGDGARERAIADLDQAVRHNPRYAMAYNNRGVLYLADGDEARAAADFGQALRLDPELTLAWYNRGRVRYAADDFENALADLDEAVRLSPDYADPYRFRALVNRALGRTDAATADLRQVVRLIPEDRQARRALCRALRDADALRAERRAACR